MPETPSLMGGGKSSASAGENTLKALTREIEDLTNELSTRSAKKRKGKLLKGKKDDDREWWKRIVPKGPPAGAYGVGCGVGVGAGLSGGLPIFPLFGPAVKLVFGVGAGCGVGMGFGWGFGKGRYWDKPGETIVSTYRPGGNAKPPAAGKPGGKAGQVIMR